MQHVATFQEATNTAIGHSATRGEPTLASVGVLEKQLQEANTHYQAFKPRSYKEVLAILNKRAPRATKLEPVSYTDLARPEVGH